MVIYVVNWVRSLIGTWILEQKTQLYVHPDMFYLPFNVLIEFNVFIG